MTMFRTDVSSMAIIAAGMAAFPAVAQVTSPPAAPSRQITPAEAPTDQAAPDIVEDGDIIVTAQRRSESLNRVGVSVAAIGGDELRAFGVTKTDDLAKLVPGFQATVSPLGGAPIYTLRGIGFNAQSAGSTTPVGVYLDEVAFPYPYSSIGVVFDLERVEVLKGPQGTLFGRNTTGGLVGFISAKPTDTPQARIGASFGNFETYTVDGFASGPITDTLKGRFAFNVETRNKGWQRSVTRNERMGERKQVAFRGSLEWNPLDVLKLEGSVNYWERHSDVQQPQAIFFFNPTRPIIPTGALASVIANPTSNQQADWVDFSRQPQANTTGQIRPPYGTDSHFILGTLRGTLDLSNQISVTSLTSYGRLKYNDVVDFSGLQVESGVQRSLGTISDFSQEVRLLGDFGALNGSIGGYYAKSKNYTDQLGYVDENATIIGLRNTAIALSGRLPGVYTRDQILQSYRNYHDNFTIRDTVKAVFANAEFALSDTLKIKAGARYTEDRVEFNGCTVDTAGRNLPVVNIVFPVLTRQALPLAVAGQCITLNRALTDFAGTIDTEQSQSNVAWRGGIDWTPSNTVLLYGLVSRGYKSGSYPIVSGSTVSQFDPIKQEKLTAYEVGSKIGLFDRRLQVNSSLYYYDYTDKQLFGRVSDIIFGTLRRIVNVPKSRVWGAEVDANLRVTPEFSLHATGAYLNTKIQQFTSFDDNGAVFDFRGRPFAQSPKWQFAGTAAYDTPVSERLAVATRLTVTHQSSSFGNLAGGDLFRIKGYTLADATIGLHGTDRTWNVDLFVNNIFDKYYWTNVNAGIDTIYRYTGMPRTYGVRLSHSF